MENGSNYCFPCSWDGEERKWSGVEGTAPREGGRRAGRAFARGRAQGFAPFILRCLQS